MIDVKNNPQAPPRRSASGRTHSPTRETLLRMLEAQRAPVSVAALAAATGWHENTVRGHVHALWEDGYLTRSSDAAEGRGRPSWLWQAKDRLPGSPYAALAGVLAETVARLSAEPERDAREAGRAWGLSLGSGAGAPGEAPGGEPNGEPGDAPPGAPDAARDRVIEVMRDQGFAPQLRGEEGGEAVIALRQCPLIEAAARHSRVVCAVHLGMVAGVVEALGARDEGSELTPFSAPGECALRLAIAGRAAP